MIDGAIDDDEIIFFWRELTALELVKSFSRIHIQQLKIIMGRVSGRSGSVSKL